MLIVVKQSLRYMALTVENYTGNIKTITVILKREHNESIPKKLYYY